MEVWDVDVVPVWNVQVRDVDVVPVWDVDMPPVWDVRPGSVGLGAGRSVDLDIGVYVITHLNLRVNDTLTVFMSI